MKSRVLTCITPIALFAALTIPARLLAQQQIHYTVTDLGTLGGTFSFAGGINNSGDIEGFSTLQGDSILRAFRWRSGVMTDLGTFGGPNSLASWRLNERGEVGGNAETSTPDPMGEDFCGFGTHLTCLPFVWQKSVLTPLPTLGGNNGQANGVNSRGQVVGTAENTTADATCEAPQVLQFKPVIWTQGRVQELPTFHGDPDGVAVAINDEGQAVGYTGSCIIGFDAVLWQNGKVTGLGNLGGTGAIVSDINNQGQVSGFSDLPGDTTFHAFLWQNGAMTDLGTLPGDVASVADGINSKGQVVGGSVDMNGNERAFLWQNGVITDLNSVIPADSPLFLIEPTGTINSRGQIAGIGLDVSTGEIHAFLATPSNGAGEIGGATSELRLQISPKVVLPENVRRVLRQRLGHKHQILE
jgi:probable HAF family extracellular repeat protein